MQPRRHAWLPALVTIAALVFVVFSAWRDDKPDQEVTQGYAEPSPAFGISQSPSATVASVSGPPSSAAVSSIVGTNSGVSGVQASPPLPLPPKDNPEWKLIDWSLAPYPGKPGSRLRASLWSAPGKYSHIRIEEEVDDSSPPQVIRRTEMVGSQVIVRLSDGATPESLRAAVKLAGGVLAPEPFAAGTWLADLPPRLDAVPDAVKALQQTQITDYAEPNFLVRPMRIPNDPRMVNFSQWHLCNNTQIDKDIKAPRAWDRRTSAAYGSTNKVIVAVIDSGVRYTHEDLAANMWTNPGEIPEDGIDNDGNGLVDDVYGADYLGGDGDPMTTASHGTHCAGLIGAVGNNGLGVSGVAWSGVQIMALRFIDGTGSISDSIKCIDYAIAKGAKVINASYGSTYQDDTGSSSEAAAIYRAQQAGITIVAAAGNGGADNVGDDNDTAPFYPASYTEYVFRTFPLRTYALHNIISVGATDRNESRASFSNYGANSVDLMAPGVEMWSTTISGTSDSSYASSQGTSFAAPVVAGAVALLVAEYPNDTVAQRVARVISANAVDVIPSLSGLCVTGGRLNLAKLLPAADPNTLPQAVVWHRPSYPEPLINSAMRTPGNAVYSNNITIYSGVKKFNNTDGINTSGLVNQSGGWLFYRSSPSAAWSSNALSWHTNNGDYQFWKATISNVPAGALEYYLQLDFESGARTTYSHYADNVGGFAASTNSTTAQSAPYSFAVAKAAATIAFAGTNQTYDGSPRIVTVTTAPPGLAAVLTYDGGSSAPANAGTYTVLATLDDPNYSGSASGTLTVDKALAGITLANLAQVYDGTPKGVFAATAPDGLPVSVTYAGSVQPPSAVGSYAVEAVVTDLNYQGGATGMLSIQLSSFDAWRLANFGEPWEGDPASMALSDADADGANNHAEYFLGTDPNNPGSGLRAVLTGAGSGVATLEVSPAVTNGIYRLKSWSDLGQTASTNTLSITSGSPSAVFELPVSSDKSFYQVIYEPPLLP